MKNMSKTLKLEILTQALYQISTMVNVTIDDMREIASVALVKVGEPRPAKPDSYKFGF
jgi:hypothetical protein